MSKVEIKMNISGLQKFRKSKEVMDIVKDEARKMGEIESSYVGFDRVQVVVKERKE